jgi:hypothetical protein
MVIVIEVAILEACARGHVQRHLMGANRAMVAKALNMVVIKVIVVKVAKIILIRVIKQASSHKLLKVARWLYPGSILAFNDSHVCVSLFCNRAMANV